MSVAIYRARQKSISLKNFFSVFLPLNFKYSLSLFLKLGTALFCGKFSHVFFPVWLLIQKLYLASAEAFQKATCIAPQTWYPQEGQIRRDRWPLFCFLNHLQTLLNNTCYVNHRCKKTCLRFFIQGTFFYVFNVFHFVNVFIFKNVHWKYHLKSLSKQQKQIITASFPSTYTSRHAWESSSSSSSSSKNWFRWHGVNH